MSPEKGTISKGHSSSKQHVSGDVLVFGGSGTSWDAQFFHEVNGVREVRFSAGWKMFQRGTAYPRYEGY